MTVPQSSKRLHCQFGAFPRIVRNYVCQRDTVYLKRYLSVVPLSKTQFSIRLSTSIPLATTVSHCRSVLLVSGEANYTPFASGPASPLWSAPLTCWSICREVGEPVLGGCEALLTTATVPLVPERSAGTASRATWTPHNFEARKSSSINDLRSGPIEHRSAEHGTLPLIICELFVLTRGIPEGVLVSV